DPDTCGNRHCKCSPEGDADYAWHDRCAASPCGHSAQQRGRSASIPPQSESGWPPGLRQKRREASLLQRQNFRPKRMQLAPDALGDLRDAKFVAGMCAYCVMRHELLGDLLGERGVEAPTNIDRCQFFALACIVRPEFR